MLESLEIVLRVVGSALFPAGKKDADPFESDRAYRGVMAFTASALVIVMGFSPRAVADGTAGKFVKRLAQELWAGLPEVNTSPPFALFAALDATGTPHWSNARKGGYLQSRFPAPRV